MKLALTRVRRPPSEFGSRGRTTARCSVYLTPQALFRAGENRRPLADAPARCGEFTAEFPQKLLTAAVPQTLSETAERCPSNASVTPPAAATDATPTPRFASA